MKKTAPLSIPQAILHPVRMRILVTLGDRPLTPLQIARQLNDIPLGTLYRHINILLSAGLIQVVGERRVHGTIERQFALVEEKQIVNREELTAESLQGLVASLTSVIQASFGRYIERQPMPPPEGAVSLLVQSVYLTPEESQALRQTITDYSRKTGRGPGEGYERRIIAYFSVPDVSPAESLEEPESAG